MSFDNMGLPEAVWAPETTQLFDPGVQSGQGLWISDWTSLVMAAGVGNASAAEPVACDSSSGTCSMGGPGMVRSGMAEDGG